VVDAHERHAAWLAGVVAGADELALHDAALAGFVRIVTTRDSCSLQRPPCSHPIAG